MLKRILKRLNKYVTYYKLRARRVYISKTATVINCSFEQESAFNRIDNYTMLINCNIGRGTYLQDNCKFFNADIGRYCSIASGAKMVVGDHPTSKYVSMHPSFYSGRPLAGLNFKHVSFNKEYRIVKDDRYCVVENDVWIGTDAIILGGVTIHNGAVIAAGSIVTKDIPPYAVVAGVPAKIIKYRFSDEQIKRLLEINWWEKENEWIQKHIQDFDDIEQFVKSNDI